MKRFFGSKPADHEDHDSFSNQQQPQLHEQPRRDPGRARHSVAVSSYGTQTGINRLAGNLPSSRSHAQISRNGHHPSSTTNQISKRSISASYISKAPSQQQRFSRASGPYSSTRGRSSFAPLLASTPEKPKTRIEKIKTKIHQKLDMSSYLDLPADKWMEFQEYFELMDWDELGYTFGIGLNGLHLLIRTFSALESMRRNHMASGNTKQTTRSWFSFGVLEAMSLCSFLMCIYSCYNAYTFFTHRRAYQLHHREDVVNSPNVTLVQSPTAPQEEPPSWRDTTISILKRILSACIGWPSLEIHQLPKPTQVYQLNVSQIDPVKLKVFIAYPPPQAFLLHFANFSESWAHWLLLMALAVSQNYFVVNHFSQLVRDKEIIQAEVMHEYNTKFVYPKAFPLTREASTMTSSAEFIRREDWMSY
ncbi:hypothetical protein MJO28_009790 [Puccinia striiformis f. sp. tritici]|uniref:Uncharacterized protein n=2 Tax=Puccinia striiformis f. sp. tritici TaxID=168172 RepID=A0A0L0VMX3_9BASI|nr:hypothetical protein Pst134EA_017370 [Puccinia striiformis f. sp. tritici]KAI9615366.1 hypothetical protein KEM48_005657 [Puccinia striiformis f. sp. tritici PST-130]KNF00606.1 hypothetical protein PSTG_06022 [Puccinia striiformis f. sp. tritici PST-78]KAH9450769.1 hypothetical protein Pst134EB_018284 [Puccinia striiformis f. sp. tritici]KAH9461061.1 hypothetical protein Pst134EA_017370 [Puccinia striiformis f. sp. tritici]KAI7947882.1 hypothetical protein MJO28_009790 [Puccinia striiformis